MMSKFKPSLFTITLIILILPILIFAARKIQTVYAANINSSEAKLNKTEACNQYKETLADIKDTCNIAPYPGIDGCIWSHENASLRYQDTDLEQAAEESKTADTLKELKATYVDTAKDCGVSLKKENQKSQMFIKKQQKQEACNKHKEALSDIKDLCGITPYPGINACVWVHEKRYALYQDTQNEDTDEELDILNNLKDLKTTYVDAAKGCGVSLKKEDTNSKKFIQKRQKELEKQALTPQPYVLPSKPIPPAGPFYSLPSEQVADALSVDLAPGSPASTTLILVTIPAIENQTLTTVLRLLFTNGGNTDVNIKSIRFRKKGIFINSGVNSMYLYDDDIQIASSSLSSDNTVTFSSNEGLFKVFKNATKTITVKLKVNSTALNPFTISEALIGLYVGFSIDFKNDIVPTPSLGTFPLRSNNLKFLVPEGQMVPPN